MFMLRSKRPSRPKFIYYLSVDSLSPAEDFPVQLGLVFAPWTVGSRRKLAEGSPLFVAFDKRKKNTRYPHIIYIKRVL